MMANLLAGGVEGDVCVVLPRCAPPAAELQHPGAAGGPEPDAAHCGLQVLHAA